MNEALIQSFKAREHRFGEDSRQCKARYNRLAMLRLLVFAAGFALTVYVFSVHLLIGALFALLFIGGFYRLVLNHQALQQRGEHLALLSFINAREAAMLEDPFAERKKEWPVIYDGSDFMDSSHPYATDLDLFGPHSFFGYANRSGTYIGARRLADMLGSPASIPEIRKRQEGIAELAPRLDWRQDMEAIGQGTEDNPRHIALLREWLHVEPWATKIPWLTVAFIVNPIIVSLGLIGWLAAWFAWPVALLSILPAGLILRRTLERVNHTHQRTTHAERALAQYGKLIAQLEGQSWSGVCMREVTSPFRHGKEPASRSIRRLSWLISQLNLRYNFFAIFLNLFALWDLYWVRRLEKWKMEHREDLLTWFEALSEAEALSSLGTLRYNHPDWAIPEIHSEPVLEGQALGHPLIPSSMRVGNDLQMPTQGHIKLITGSNMAGKSTFLRTVGLNLVLAMAGSCVCARSLRMPPLQVHTSMRTQDALHENTSSFYAELKRLHGIIQAVESRKADEPQVFFLLDEILKGTNSVDRHAGSEALIRQFIQNRGTGLIATHDLELGSMAADSGGAIENLCMEVEIANGELVFDYKLKPGVSESFNATLLMQKMGIHVSPSHRKEELN